MTSALFSPYRELADALLPHVSASEDDGAHDVAHLGRVWRNVTAIQAKEGGDGEILAAATLLHDCVPLSKDSPLRAQASSLAAEKAADILTGLRWKRARVDAVCHAIAAHSFSAAIEPRTLEAEILQDADRLDAIGLIGVARCFYTAGRMGSALYHPSDPEALDRPHDDRRYAIDHFHTKLLTLADGCRTATAAQIARERRQHLQRFLEGFLAEIRGEPVDVST